MNNNKAALRDQLLAARREIGLPRRNAAALSYSDLLLAASETRRAATIAAYLSVGSEPGTGPLLAQLLRSGKRILLPILAADNDLDWAVFDGNTQSASRGLLEPTTSRLGLDAIGQADLVITPGLAASLQGDRLGRGGGSYDRALARVPAQVPIFCLLYPNEIFSTLPTEPHDRKVTAAVLPDQIVSLPVAQMP